MIEIQGDAKDVVDGLKVVRIVVLLALLTDDLVIAELDVGAVLNYVRVFTHTHIVDLVLGIGDIGYILDVVDLAVHTLVFIRVVLSAVMDVPQLAYAVVQVGKLVLALETSLFIRILVAILHQSSHWRTNPQKLYQHSVRATLNALVGTIRRRLLAVQKRGQSVLHTGAIRGQVVVILARLAGSGRIVD